MSQPAPDPVEFLRQRTTEWLEEVAVLRRQASEALPRIGAPPQAYAEALRAIRPLLDRVEEIHATAISLSGGARRAAAESAAQAQEAWDAQATAQQRARSGSEYEGAQERYARWNLATLAHRRQARRDEHAAGIALDAEKRIRLAHQGIEGMRQELVPVLRFLQWETSNER